MAKKTTQKNNFAIEPKKHRKILQMLEAGCSVRDTARAVGVGINTVQRRQSMLAAECTAEITRDDGSEAITFRAARWRCPVHGPVTVRPCVMCTSLAAVAARGRQPSVN